MTTAFSANTFGFQNWGTANTPTQPQRHSYHPRPNNYGFQSSMWGNGNFNPQALMALLQQLLSQLGNKSTGTTTANKPAPHSNASAHEAEEHGVRPEHESHPNTSQVSINNQVIIQPAPLQPIPVANGKVESDMRIYGAENELMYFTGSKGLQEGIFNFLSDKNLQVNFKLQEQTPNLYSAVKPTEVGFTVRNATGVHNIQVAASGSLVIDGKAIDPAGGTYKLGDTTVVHSGDKTVIHTPEYEMSVTRDKELGSLSTTFRSDNAVADSVKPHGIFGQTVDGDGRPRPTAMSPAGRMGDTLLDRVPGSGYPGDESEVYKLYQVRSLFDVDFANFNRFDGQQ